MTEKNDFFSEINAQIKKGSVPDTLTVGGRVYQAVGTAPQKVRKDWKNPRNGDVVKDVEHEWITVNVAPHADRITINGIHYMQGRTYEIPVFMADDFRSIMALTWRHEQQTGGANSFGVAGVRNFAAAAGAGIGFAS